MNESPNAGRVLCAVLIPLLTTSMGANAQESKHDGTWRGTAGLAATLSRGNADTTHVAGQLDAYRATAIDKWSIHGTTVYGSQRVDGADQRTADNLRLGARYDHDLRERIFWFGLGEFEYDTLADLDVRLTAASGLGYKALRSERSTVDVFSGLGATRTDYDRGGSDVDLEVLVGVEARHAFNDTVSVRQKFTLYPNLSEGGEFRSVFDAALLVALTNRLNLQVGLQNRYDSLVPTGARRSDTVFMTGISLRIGAD